MIFLDDYVAMAPLEGDSYAVDTVQVHTFLVNFVFDNDTAKAKIQGLLRPNDGREAYKRPLVVHYKGVGIHAVDIREADEVLKSLFYAGKKPPHMRCRVLVCGQRKSPCRQALSWESHKLGSTCCETLKTVFNVEDASNFRAQGFGVDDDNEPAPENIPQAEDNIEDCAFFAWDETTLDERRKAGVRDVKPSLVNADATLHTILGYFVHFLPVSFIKSILIPATNASLSEPLTWEEFLRLIGLIFVMATMQGVANPTQWGKSIIQCAVD